MLDASAIIVNYRSEDHVTELLEQLMRKPMECPSQLIVVDNSPEGGLSRRLEFGRSRICYRAMDRNVGFAAAVNAGLEKAHRKFVILLNPDARPEPGCLAGLLQELHVTSAAAIAGPRLTPFNDGDPEIPSATLIEPRLKTILAEYTVLQRLFPGLRAWLRYHYFPGDADSPVDAAMVQGACFAFPREWSERVGGFDVRFFMYWEETDFCRRVREQGGKVRYCPQLLCRHASGASVESAAVATQHYWRSFYAYLEKHHGRFYALTVRALMLPGVGAEYLILRVLDSWRRGKDHQLTADKESMRLRLRGQLLKPAR